MVIEPGTDSRFTGCTVGEWKEGRNRELLRSISRHSDTHVPCSSVDHMTSPSSVNSFDYIEVWAAYSMCLTFKKHVKGSRVFMWAYK